MEYIIKKYCFLHVCMILFILIGQIDVNSNVNTISLTVVVSGLRNSDGVVVFGLYNRKDAFPDENYKKYFRKISGKINNNTASVTFENLLPDTYAVNILHDEDNDGRIKMGFLLPKEGIGFSNFKSIGLLNKPNFSKASFELLSDSTVKIKIIYM